MTDSCYILHEVNVLYEKFSWNFQLYQLDVTYIVIYFSLVWWRSIYRNKRNNIMDVLIIRNIKSSINHLKRTCNHSHTHKMAAWRLPFPVRRLCVYLHPLPRDSCRLGRATISNRRSRRCRVPRRDRGILPREYRLCRWKVVGGWSQDPKGAWPVRPRGEYGRGLTW